jgi:hypothetical protein
MRVAYAVLVAIGSMGARVEAQPALPVALAMSPCAGAVTPRDGLVGPLQIELGATLERPIALVAPEAGDADLQLGLDCTGVPDVLELRIERRQPPGRYRGSIDARLLPEPMRTRTIALAVAEQLRWLEPPPPEPVPVVAPATPSPTVPSPAPATAPSPALATVPSPTLALAPSPPRRNLATLRRARNWAIGFGVTAAVLSSVGGSLISDAHPSDGGMVAAGAATLSLGIAAVAGTGVSFGYWLRERRRPLDGPERADAAAR